MILHFGAILDSNDSLSTVKQIYQCYYSWCYSTDSLPISTDTTYNTAGVIPDTAESLSIGTYSNNATYIAMSYTTDSLPIGKDANDATAGVIPDTTDYLSIDTDVNDVTSDIIPDTTDSVYLKRFQ